MTENETSYSPDELQNAMQLTKDLKNVVVKAQDYDIAAKIRDIEKYFLEKIDKDSNRKI